MGILLLSQFNFFFETYVSEDYTTIMIPKSIQEISVKSNYKLRMKMPKNGISVEQ